MSLELYGAYLAACFLIVIVPGPSVTVIISNSLRHGTRAGLLNVAGTQLGIAIFITLVGFGLTSAIAALGHWFWWLRLAGAAYLIWIGIKMLRANVDPLDGAAPRAPRGGFFAQGLLVALSNPKLLLFFGAFFPQFLDPARNTSLQIALMGVTALIVAAISDSTYAVLCGRAGRALSRRRIRLLSRASGGLLVGGGLWLALSRGR
jgi:homoserine/homoserine lactone efflux protein